jgi:hypothetical protein
LRAPCHRLDPTDYQRCWAIDALCEHLQAVTDGQIKKLLVNFPHCEAGGQKQAVL